jgi:Pyruvate kinase, barrel domain
MLPHTWCRAEATDVANAVMDGADAFLLGAETLRGFHPVLTIATILSIARQAEAVFDHTHHFDHLMTVGPLPSAPQSPVLSGGGCTSTVTERRMRCSIAGGAD